MQGWFLDWLGVLREKEMAIGIMLMYQLWHARNEARNEPKIEDPRNVARRAVYRLRNGSSVRPPILAMVLLHRWWSTCVRPRWAGIN